MVSGSNRLPATALPHVRVACTSKNLLPLTAGRRFFACSAFARGIYNFAALCYTECGFPYCAAFAASGGRGNVGARPRESVTVKPPDGG